MDGFTKLFSTIITSSVWSEDDKVRIMWVTLLASADANGYVSGSVPGMAAVARMSVEDARRSIEILCSPDPDSRTKDHEGRRLLPCEGGWILTNYQKYRAMREAEARRNYQRDWDRQNRPSGHQRAKQSGHSPTQSDKSDRVRPRQRQRQKQKQNKKEGYLYSKGGGVFIPPTANEVDDYARKISYHRPDLGRDFLQKYEATGWLLSNGEPMTNWKLTVQSWRRNDERNPHRAGGPAATETVAPVVRGADGLTPRERVLQEAAR